MLVLLHEVTNATKSRPTHTPVSTIFNSSSLLPLFLWSTYYIPSSLSVANVTTENLTTTLFGPIQCKVVVRKT